MKRTIFIIFLIINSIISYSQYSNIEIDNNSNVSVYLNEPFINFNPNNPNVLLIGSNLSNAYFSTDKGFTWTKTTLSSSAYGIWGDPCVISDVLGNYYYFHLSNPPSGGSWIDRIVCQKSEDAGQTWDVISFVGLNNEKINDKETAVVDRVNNHIYLTWTQADNYHSTNPLDSSIILFSSSDDLGITWSVPERISKHAGNSNGDSGMLRSVVPAVGPNGEVYISWAGKDESGNLGIIFDKSTDYGKTWLDDDIYVSDFPGGSHFDIPGIFPGMGAGWSNMACDTSGRDFNGNIYINWADQRNGTNDTDIWMIKSVNGGDSWSSPIRVNNDSEGKHQFFTWMTVDQITGYLYFIFYDRRNHTDNSTDVYLAVSEDGGETFTNKKISNTPFIPTEDVFFGDFNNIIAYNGMIRPVWTRLNGGTISINTAIIEAPVKIYKPNSSFLIDKSYPNPFKEEIHYSFKIRNTSLVKLKFIDIYGREISNLIDDELSPGKYVKTINAKEFNLSSGIYYFLLSVDNQETSKKVIYIK